MHVQTWGKDAKKMGWGTCLCCPETGQEAMDTSWNMLRLNINKCFVPHRWESTGTGSSEILCSLLLGDLQKLSGHSPGQPWLGVPVWAHITPRVFWQLQPFCYLFSTKIFSFCYSYHCCRRKLNFRCLYSIYPLNKDKVPVSTGTTYCNKEGYYSLHTSVH